VGRVVDRKLQGAMLDEYYALRGWSNDGVPLPETLGRLGLNCITASAPRLELCYEECG
jgi:aldehyde:ferredoxin oxidoreductase